MNPMRSDDGPPCEHRDIAERPDSPETIFSPEEIAEARKRLRSPGPFYFGEQVQDHLRALEQEWERTGGFDTEYLKAFLARLAEEDPPHYRVSARK